MRHILMVTAFLLAALGGFINAGPREASARLRDQSIAGQMLRELSCPSGETGTPLFRTSARKATRRQPDRTTLPAKGKQVDSTKQKPGDRLGLVKSDGGDRTRVG